MAKEAPRSSGRRKSDVVPAVNVKPVRSSLVGRFLRRLADLFDGNSGRSLFAGTPREIDIVTLGLVFGGLVVAGTFIHGWSFLFWNALYAAVFCAATWTIFYSTRWQTKTRALILAVVLIVSVAAASERVMAMAAFVVLLLFLARSLLSHADFIRRETISVVAVALFCFSSYDAFAGVLEWRRSAALTLSGAVPVECGATRSASLPQRLREIWNEIWSTAQAETLCKAGAVSFSVPDFWQRGRGSNLIRDLSSVADLKIYADSATDNSIAFAAFSAPPAQLMQQIANFFSVQKGFLRSRDPKKVALVPEQIVKSADTQLYGLRYESEVIPGYLAENAEFNAMILLHERRGVTWLFILDGKEVAAREFLLHRVISGFR